MRTTIANFNFRFVAGLTATVILPATLLAAAYRSAGMFFAAMSLYSLSAAIGVALFGVRSIFTQPFVWLNLEGRVSRRTSDRLRKAA